MIRLLDDSKIYLHAVIDNFSRKILAWDLQERVMGRTTTAVLEQAARFLGGGVVNLMTDSGLENINETVDDLLAASPIRRVLAQVEIPESNSMIEAFWRSIRHQWLYLHDLDSLATVRRLADLSHRRAQCGDSPRRLRWPNAGRGLLRPAFRCVRTPGAPHDGALGSSRPQSIAVVRGMSSTTNGPTDFPRNGVDRHSTPARTCDAMS